jgi:hypothetical protein
MRPEPDSSGDIPPDSDSVRSQGTPNQNASSQSRGTKPFTGGFYWFPTQTRDGITWSVVNCRDLGCKSDDGHDAELWPRLIVRLAVTWGKDPQILKRRLHQYYTGLPRGRVTRPDRTFLILHGNDLDIAGYEELIIESFRLSGRKYKFVFDEHETQIPGHSERFSSIFGPIQ